MPVMSAWRCYSFDCFRTSVEKKDFFFFYSLADRRVIHQGCGPKPKRRIMRLLFAATKPAVRRVKRHQSSSDSVSINIDNPENQRSVRVRRRARGRSAKRRATRFLSKHGPFVNVMAMIRTDFGEDLSAGSAAGVCPEAPGTHSVHKSWFKINQIKKGPFQGHW